MPPQLLGCLEPYIAERADEAEVGPTPDATCALRGAVVQARHEAVEGGQQRAGGGE